MKTYIIHGDYSVKSYDRLQQYIKAAKKRSWEIVRVDSKITNIRETLVSQSLFTKQRLIVVENINAIKKKDSEWLKKKNNELDATLLLYHNSALSKTAVNLYPKPDKIEEFKLPKTVWNLLDSIRPGNSQKVIELLENTLKTESEEFVFAVIAKLFRDLYWVKVDTNPPFSSWQLSKLREQTSYFKKEVVLKIIDMLSEADIKAKTTKQPIRQSLDFIFCTVLE